MNKDDGNEAATEAHCAHHLSFLVPESVDARNAG